MHKRGRMQNLGILFDWDGVIIDSSKLHENSWEILSGIRELIGELKENGIPYCIASSTPKANIEAVLNKVGAKELFPNIVAAEDVSFGKPHPEVFLKAAQTIGIAAKNCVVIEDAMDGIEAAIRAGAARIAIRSTHRHKEFLHAHLTVDTVKDLGIKEILSVHASHKSDYDKYSKLSKEDAHFRRGSVKGNVEFRADLLVASEGRGVSGTVTIRWEQKKEASIWLDYRGTELGQVLLDGKEILPDWKGGARLILPKTESGFHTVCINIRVESNRSGMGLTLVNADQESFLYTNFVPMEASSLYPCMDQPDIKAHFQLSLTCQKDWLVITNTREAQTVETADVIRHDFCKSRPLSSYLWHFSAGNFVSVSYEGQSSVPMRLFFRKKKQAYLDHDVIFSLVDRGVLWFEKFFGVPFPYEKYDQIFLPGFYWGGMENAASVVLREEILFESPPSPEQLFDRGNLLLHELSHMWFGDLVTMKWWDDLWLNEAFATWVSYRAQRDFKEFGNAELVFLEDVLHKAMDEDDLASTHPVVVDCPDTEQAFLNFDAITYQKGACLIQQICSHLGETRFSQGLNHYLQSYFDKNADLNDFLTAFEDKDLHKFSEQWLMSTGYPTLKYSLNGDYRTEEFENRDYYPISRKLVEVKDESFVFLNLDQKGYGRVYIAGLKDSSLIECIKSCPEPIFKLGLLQQYWNGVWHLEYSVPQYLGIVCSLAENNDFVLQAGIRKLLQILSMRSDLLDYSLCQNLGKTVYFASDQQNRQAFLLWIHSLYLKKDRKSLCEIRDGLELRLEQKRALELNLAGLGEAVSYSLDSSEECRLHNLRLELIQAVRLEPKSTLHGLMNQKLGNHTLDSATFGKVAPSYFWCAESSMVSEYFVCVTKLLKQPLDMVLKHHWLNSMFPGRYGKQALNCLPQILNEDPSLSDRRTLIRWQSLIQNWARLCL
ncbi:MAG: HAD-IA family hydrolase [Candidatus Cloacimonetes bacterium]|nr:HAD-IA family hydrolase [Candidatus Cloacimonadota bacterium]